MRWKSSLARFVCAALGLKPEEHILDLSSESGRSVWIRRTSTGDVIFKRALLEAVFMCADEYLLADKKVRTAVGHFISGRKAVPIENELLEIKPVTFLTLNPKNGKSLSDRTTFAVPQLRRLVLLDTDKVELPDLALRGDAAVQAAVKHEPLQITPPKTDCTEYRGAVIQTLRSVLTPEAEGLVDFDLVLGLCRGMTSFIEEGETAIRQVLHDFCLILETLGLVKEHWFHSVDSFTVSGKVITKERPLRREEIEDKRIINLQPKEGEEQTMGRKENMMPELYLTEATKSRLVYCAHHFKMNVDRALNKAISHLMLQELKGKTLPHLERIVSISDECEENSIPVAQVRAYLECKTALKKHELTPEDLPQAIQIAESLAEAELSFQDAAHHVETYRKLKEANIEFEDLEQVKADIEAIHKLAETPENEVKEIASWLAETHKLKENLDSLHIKEEKAKGRLDGVNREIAMLKKARIARKQECCNVIAQIEQHEKKLADLTEQLEPLKVKVQNNIAGLLLVDQFQQFLLSNKVDSDDLLWKVLRNVFDLKKTQDYSNRPVPPKFFEAVRIEIARLLRKIVDEDIVTWRDKDLWRKLEKVKAAEELCAAPSEALSKAEKGMKKIDEGLDEVRDAKYAIERSLEKIKHPYSNT